MRLASSGLSLAELVRELRGPARIEGDEGVHVRGVQQDSRRVEEGDLFVARAGAGVHGGRFVLDARQRGAAAVLTDLATPVPPGTPVVRVEDVARALAYAAAAVYGHPSFSLDVVGVTGTNGKTTTTHLVRAAIDGALGKPACGVIGTVGHAFGDLSIPALHTTPEPDELARVLAAMRDRGASHVAMEVSSIALSSGRARAVRFRVAAFTNLTQDHLDFHGTMEAYAAAKASLFTELSPGSAVLHVDDPFGRKLLELVRTPVVRVSTRVGTGASADVFPRRLELSARGIDADVGTPAGDVRLRSPLLGAHNVENLLVALGIVVALGLDVHRAAAALANEQGAPGRLQRCEGPDDDVTVLVDYAHTPDALARALEAVRPFVEGRLLCVFGCGGDRDKTKRAPMGKVVAEKADLAVVTNDNPRGEEPANIALAVLSGFEERGATRVLAEDLPRAGKGYLVELDRAAAIRTAILAARAGDLILVAGKGHEDYQIVGAEKRPFDDRAQAALALRERRAGRGA